MVTPPPAYFGDLNLDQIIDALTKNKGAYNLKPFFYTPISDAKIISYRHAVMQDLEMTGLLASMRAFIEKMSILHQYLDLVEKSEFYYHKRVGS